MKATTSIYLDLVRFCAAMMVFLEHFREHTLYNFNPYWRAHPFWNWHLGSYSQIAVIVFFVLSGYVIAHVLATRENTPIAYAASRFGRLYSVVLPALLLVALSNFLVELKYPGAYADFDSLGEPGILVRYLGTALFVSHYWLWPDLEPPGADPMWSLSFEATYYVAIGLFVFARGRVRLFAILALSLLAGPSIVLLLPTWALGYLAYHVKLQRPLKPGLAFVAWLAFSFLLLLCPLIREHVRVPLSFLRMPDKHLGELLTAYAAAFCFAASLLAFDAFSESAKRFVVALRGIVRWLGSMTFALYLFHQPLLTFFSVYWVVRPSTAPMFALFWIFGGTLLITATLGRYCELSKGAYRKAFLSVCESARIRFTGRAP